MKRLIAALAVLACATVRAVDYTWNGGTSGEWTAPGNWTPSTGYPNGADDTAAFAVSAATTITVDSAVTVKGVTVSGTAALTLTGSAITLGASGIASTSTAAVDISNAISVSDAATPLVNGGTAATAVAGPFHFRGVISGAGGLAKSGQGSIHLYCDNPFEGAYTATGNLKTEDGKSTNCSWGYSTTSIKGSSDTFIYNCGALGRTSANFNVSGGRAERLIVCAAGTIDIPITPSASYVKVSGVSIGQCPITIQDVTGAVTFNKAVKTAATYTTVDIRSAATVNFTSDVITLYGRVYYFFNASGAHVHYYKALTPYASGLAAGFQLHTSGTFSDIGLHLHGTPRDATARNYPFYIYNVPVYCETGEVLPRWMNMGFGNGGWVDLKGSDQLVTGGKQNASDGEWGPIQGDKSQSTPTISSGATEFGFTSSTGTAKLRCAGTAVRNSIFPGRFTGGAGLEWDPQAAGVTLTLKGNAAKTMGEFDVKSGRVLLTGGYNIQSLASLKVAADAVFEVDATASLAQKVYAVDLTSGGTGGLALSNGVSFAVNTLTVDGGEPLAAGTYTKDSAALAGTLVGGGRIVVGSFGIPCEWQGGSTGDWNDPANWSVSGVPGATHDVTIGSATVTVNGATPKVRELVLGSGATLLFTNAVTSVEADSIVIGSGAKVTHSGSFTDEASLCRVWLKCGELSVSSGGSIDVSKRGWKPLYGTSASNNGTGPGQPGWWYAGATHGGRGGFADHNWTETIKYPYGDAYEPVTAGSSGQSCGGGYDVSGGGVVRIEATGRVTVNGSILANGGSTAANWSHYETAGAGGSVWITAASVGGTGTIAAEGGKGASPDLPLVRYYRRNSGNNNGNGYDHYPAGGGRIAIYVDKAAQAAAPATGLYVSAAEGTYQGRPTQAGYTPPARGFADADFNCVGAEPGTVYFNESTLLYQLFGSGLSGRLVDVDALSFAGDVTMTRGHVRPMTEGFTVTVGGNLTIDGDARLDVGGVCLTNRMVVAEVWAGRKLNKITIGGDLTLAHGGALEINAAETNATMAWGGEVNVAGSVTVVTGGWLIATCDQENFGAPHFAVAGDFTVEEGGVVSADGRGGLGGNYYSDPGFSVNRASGFGPGAGTGMGAGGYGGCGGAGSAPTWGGAGGKGKTYGDAWRPDMCGSGGGEQVSKAGGSGGGLVFVEAGGAVTVDGTVTANGFCPRTSVSATSASVYRQQAGSGGGIYLCGETFAGKGTIKANGGDALNEKDYGTQGPGGGGRIAVRTGYAKQLAGNRTTVKKIGNELPNFTGTATASGGTLFKCSDKTADALYLPSSYLAPEDGTIRYSTLIYSPGMVITVR